MSLMFKQIAYASLNARQQEAFNFQKVSAVLADYGYITIRLTNDWRGADFIAQHFDGTTFLKVQLKGRCTFDKKYIGQDLYLCFPHGDEWFLYPHDEVLQEMTFIDSESWKKSGLYSFPKISKKLRIQLEPYRIAARVARGIPTS